MFTDVPAYLIPDPPRQLADTLCPSPEEWGQAWYRARSQPLGYRGYETDSDVLDRDEGPPNYDGRRYGADLQFTDGEENPGSPPPPGETRFVVTYGRRDYRFFPDGELGVVIEDCTDLIGVRNPRLNAQLSGANASRS